MLGDVADWLGSSPVVAAVAYTCQGPWIHARGAVLADGRGWSMPLM
jgi:hypothetical protein